MAVLIAVVASLFALTLTGCGIDSATAQPSNANQSEANEKVVVDFYNGFFNDHQVDEAAQVVADDYRQHNPNVPDGKEPFVSFFKKSFAENPAQRSKIVRSAATDDLVFLHVHSTDGPTDRGTAVVDIFRVSAGKIVEHWDVIQQVPEKSANSNTMF